MTEYHDKPIDKELVILLAHMVAREQADTAILSIHAYEGKPCVQMSQSGGLQQIARPRDWAWVDRGKLERAWDASVTAGGVKFFAIFTDEEKAQALGETDQSLDKST